MVFLEPNDAAPIAFCQFSEYAGTNAMFASTEE
jgi:hypothetical protein